MSPKSEADLRLLDNPSFPRASNYDPKWVADNTMGPNVLWLAESLSQVFEFRPGMRVLDLGCGRALNSIFLAKEFGVQVWAADLWIKPTENQRRIEEAGVGDRVFPIFVEAHQLPFAEGFFDAVVSLDSYHYFGTDDCYIGYIVRFLKPNSRLAIVVPGGPRPLEDAQQFKKVMSWDFWSFHGPDWWREHWQRSGLVEVEHADLVPDGWRHWLASDRATASAAFAEQMPAWTAALEASGLLVEAIQSVLGEDLVGAWLHGGTTFPDRPRQVGDLDICAVVSRAAPADRDPSSWQEDPQSRPSRLRAAQKSIAQDRHVAFDTTYLLVDEIGGGQPPPQAFHQARPVLSWPIYRAHWRAGQYVHLHGRRPEEMVIAPTPGELVRALDRELEHLERHVFEGDSDDPYEATYAIWNGCRILYTLETGSPVISKRRLVPGDSSAWPIAGMRRSRRRAVLTRETPTTPTSSYCGRTWPLSSPW